MSKSIGNVVDPIKLIQKYGIDAIRFYMISSGPQNHDVNYEEKLINTIFYKFIPDSLSKIFI